MKNSLRYISPCGAETDGTRGPRGKRGNFTQLMKKKVGKAKIGGILHN